jgi:hypothetical protein
MDDWKMETIIELFDFLWALQMRISITDYFLLLSCNLEIFFREKRRSGTY